MTADDAEAAGIRSVADRIVQVRDSVPARRSVLVAVSGIDGCGKGYITAQVTSALEARGLRPAAINIDGWLELPDRRFSTSNPAEHFYLHAIRFNELFARLVLPLRDRRSLRIEADFAEETATSYRRHVYEFADIDVIVLEGIYLLKRALRAHYDLSIWIDCSFATALERAIARAQEGLPPEATVRAYRTIYFPAQEIHFERDDPRAAATMIVFNDPSLNPADEAPAHAGVTDEDRAGDRLFLAKFEAAAIPRDRWRHRDHVRMAFLYLRDLPVEEAINRIRSGIQALNLANRVQESATAGYHETVTVAWARLIRSAVCEHGPRSCFDEFIAAHPHLLEKSLLRLYYTRDRILSARAKASFVEPDLAPLPRAGPAPFGAPGNVSPSRSADS